MRGNHTLAHWSRTQQTVALSSAEAELNGICKASQEGLAAKFMAEEMDHHHGLEICTDASAALGVVMRHGIGKIKHLHVKQMWVQEKSREGSLLVRKVSRSVNPADLMTHHFTDQEAMNHLTLMGAVRIPKSGHYWY